MRSIGVRGGVGDDLPMRCRGRSGSNVSEPDRLKISGRVVMPRTDLKPSPKRPISTPFLALRWEDRRAPTPSALERLAFVRAVERLVGQDHLDRPVCRAARRRRSGSARRAADARSHPRRRPARDWRAPQRIAAPPDRRRASPPRNDRPPFRSRTPYLALTGVAADVVKS